ncbi:MAG TPA: FHA domain-containing protein [Pseudonocardiaceae bacterium]|nr:FHA domain-containing protein [Pseudonocardiaceae bacterium]
MPSCPAGHDSTSVDFCDVCGLEIGGAAPAAAATVETAPTSAPAPELPAELCPVCGEPRTGRFCEGCSYDFVAGAARTPVVTAEPAPAPAPVAVAVEPAAGEWSLVVAADREYFDAVRQQDGPDVPTITFPAYCPDRHFTLTGEQIRIGRASRSRGLVPEVDLTGPPQDPGVSHLHAVLLAQEDGGWAVIDPGSTNGTTINDDLEPIANDVAVPVKDGDRIHVGAWTTLTVRGPSIG